MREKREKEKGREKGRENETYFCKSGSENISIPDNGGHLPKPKIRKFIIGPLRINVNRRNEIERKEKKRKEKKRKEKKRKRKEKKIEKEKKRNKRNKMK